MNVQPGYDGDDLAGLLLRSMIGRLDVRWASSPRGSLVVIAPALPSQDGPGRPPRLDDIGRAPIVPLRPAGGDS